MELKRDIPVAGTASDAVWGNPSVSRSVLVTVGGCNAAKPSITAPVVPRSVPAACTSASLETAFTQVLCARAATSALCIRAETASISIWPLNVSASMGALTLVVKSPENVFSR